MHAHVISNDQSDCTDYRNRLIYHDNVMYVLSSELFIQIITTSRLYCRILRNVDINKLSLKQFYIACSYSDIVCYLSENISCF